MAAKLLVAAIFAAAALLGAAALSKSHPSDLSDRTDQTDETDKANRTNQTYQHERFSFLLPEGFEPVSFSHGEAGEVITVEPEREVSLPAEVKPPRPKGFQIFLTPFDEPEISAERIRRDLHDLPLQNIRSATLDGTPALIFESRDSDIGDTYEVWLVRDGYLWQIMTYQQWEEELGKVLQGWKFK